MAIDSAVVYERPVGTLKILQLVLWTVRSELGMPARYLRVVQLDAVRRVPTDRQDVLVELEPPSLIAAANDKERSHASILGPSVAGR